MKYFDELKRSMDWLGQQKTFFMGQSVTYPGTAMFNTLRDVPIEKRLELPVCEAMQTGMAIGIALNGVIPVSIYPRWNFLLLGTDQIVNHLDKMEDITGKPVKVIIRTGIGSERPLDPQTQHKGDFTEAFRLMCKNINVVRLDEPNQIFEAYQQAYNSDRSTILVEWGDCYNEK